ncbi:hypothetical protein TSOC_013823 [Tetrabaena socialis]|uniref:AAA+ ATPase domain-containing protein n=1 Tax=Tetrabaena socialis TaxID=47790 RepID=A0A2J7ZJB3_9CHLO|nr:hypothetical protein TSOC_013823 [Tetrabaena socialis]|eukprot:PNH00359.1 hypothetical protein TSOC_013823 [Tetrabaena socialis]
MGTFSAMDFAMLMMTNALTSSIVAILHGAVKIAGTMLVRVSAHNSARHWDKTINVLAAVQRHAWVWEKTDTFDYRQVPCGWLLGRWGTYLAHVTVDERSMRIVVLTWRLWCRVNDADSQKDTCDLWVVRHSSCKLDEVDYVQTRELACPMGCPSRPASEEAAERMLSAWRRDGQGRFLLQGEPGCGKSTAARLFAQKLGDCCLYPMFNPTSPGESLAELLRYVKRSQKVIVVMEEFDVVLRRVLREGKQAHKNFRVEVADKATWNNMMDMMQFQTRMGMILTTNRTDDEIAALNEEMGGSILRPGRVTEWIRFPSSLHCKKEL